MFKTHWPSSVASNTSRRLLKIGHRGAAGHAPENTLAAVRKGIELGVDLVEIDLRCTATTNGKGQIKNLTFPQVKTLNAGNGERIPTLEEVLNVVSGKTGVMLELKVSGIAEKTIVQSVAFKEPIIYASFLQEEVEIIRSVDPKASVMVLFGTAPIGFCHASDEMQTFARRSSTRHNQPRTHRGIPP